MASSSKKPKVSEVRRGKDNLILRRAGFAIDPVPPEVVLPDAPPAERWSPEQIDARTYVAFVDLHDLLYAEASRIHDGLAERGDGKLRIKGHRQREALRDRMKQLRKVAEVVNALRFALSRGPACSIDPAFTWASAIEPGPPPQLLDPTLRLAPYKEFILGGVRAALLMEGRPFLRHSSPPAPDDAVLKAGAKAVKSACSGDALPPETDQASLARFMKRHPAARIAFRIVATVGDLRSGPFQALVPAVKRTGLVRAVAKKLCELDVRSLEDPELVCANALVALGMDRSQAHTMFSYAKKRSSRSARRAD